MEEKTQSTTSPPETQPKKNTGMAIVAYILFFVPLLTDAKNDPFVKYHVKQGLVVFICGVIVSIISRILPWYFGFVIIHSLLSLAIFILVVIGIVNAAQGQEKPLPLVGKFGEQLKI